MIAFVLEFVQIEAVTSFFPYFRYQLQTLPIQDDDAEDDEPHGLHAGQYCGGVVSLVESSYCK